MSIKRCNKFFRVILVTSMIFVLFNYVVYASTPTNTIKRQNGKLIYTDNLFRFSVSFPNKWKYSIEKSWEGTETHEGSPEAGITIYIDGNKTQNIYVFGQVYLVDHGLYFGFKSENFKTYSGINGKLYRNEKNGKIEIYLVFDVGTKGAHILMTKTNYNKYKNEITEILKSIKFFK
jgi:hypothetical protein